MDANLLGMMARPRIVSMLPSATEIVDALGYSSSLVGRSHECDYPAEVLDAPAVTYARVDSSASSAIIDQSVKDRVAHGAAIYGIEENLLRQLKPDVVITQTQCEVCAVSLREVEAFLLGEAGLNTSLVVLEPNELEDVWSDIIKVAKALGIQAKGNEVVSRIKQAIGSISKKTKRLRSPRVALIEWIDPLMAGGNWMPELLQMAGAEGLFGKVGEHSPWIHWEQLKLAEPEIIIVAPCGFGLDRITVEMKNFRHLEKLKAAQNGKVFIADGNAFFNRPGPRLLDSLEILCEIVHPEHFDFGHHGKAWKAWKGAC